MKSLISKLALPLTLISFVLISKYWIVDIADGARAVIYGFPFPYLADGFYTSLSHQIAVPALIADLAIYFLVWIILLLIYQKAVKPIVVTRKMLIVIYTLVLLLILPVVAFFLSFETTFNMEKDFESKTVETGIFFFWQNSKPN